MKITYRKRFLKELSQIPFKQRKRIQHFVFEQFPKSNTILSTGKLERLKGYQGYYKVRFGAYRVGLKVSDKEVVFERVLHRKDIYRYYP